MPFFSLFLATFPFWHIFCYPHPNFSELTGHIESCRHFGKLDNNRGPVVWSWISGGDQSGGVCPPSSCQHRGWRKLKEIHHSHPAHKSRFCQYVLVFFTVFFRVQVLDYLKFRSDWKISPGFNSDPVLPWGPYPQVQGWQSLCQNHEIRRHKHCWKGPHSYLQLIMKVIIKYYNIMNNS